MTVSSRPQLHLCDVCRERGVTCAGEWDLDKVLVDCTRFVDKRCETAKRLRPLPEVK